MPGASTPSPHDKREGALAAPDGISPYSAALAGPVPPFMRRAPRPRQQQARARSRPGCECATAPTKSIACGRIPGLPGVPGHHVAAVTIEDILGLGQQAREGHCQSRIEVNGHLHGKRSCHHHGPGAKAGTMTGCRYKLRALCWTPANAYAAMCSLDAVGRLHRCAAARAAVSSTSSTEHSCHDRPVSFNQQCDTADGHLDHMAAMHQSEHRAQDSTFACDSGAAPRCTCTRCGCP